MKWIDRLIKKITHCDFNLNNSFSYYGHEICVQSGTVDYADVTIDHEHTFSFDFWTKELVLDVEDINISNALIQALKAIYGEIKITDENEK